MSNTLKQIKQDEEIFFIICERLTQPNSILTDNVQAFFDSFKEIYNIKECEKCSGYGYDFKTLNCCTECYGLGEVGYSENLKNKLLNLPAWEGPLK